MTGDAPSFFLTAVEREGDALLDAIGDLDAPVPSCPAWDVRALVAHTSEIHRAWTAVAAQRAATPDEIDRAATRWSEDKGDVVEWFDDGLRALLAVLRDIPEEATFWTWWPPQQNVAFLRRRMAHETAVHRWDCEAAYGTPRPIDPALAADGVDELLTVYLPRWAKPGGRGETIGFHATDTGDKWTLRIDDGTLDVTRDLTDPDARCAGTANDLLLSLWGRKDLDALDWSGDPAPLRRLLAEADFD